MFIIRLAGEVEGSPNNDAAAGQRRPRANEDCRIPNDIELQSLPFDEDADPTSRDATPEEIAVSTRAISFSSGNPRVEILKGVIHLFVEKSACLKPGAASSSGTAGASGNIEQPLPNVMRTLATVKDSSDMPASVGSAVNTASAEGKPRNRRRRPQRLTENVAVRPLPVRRSRLLCMLGVPVATTINELLGLLAPARAGIEHGRIVRGAEHNRYLVLLRMRTQEAADEFYRDYHGRPYNAIEPEHCTIVFVARLEGGGEALAQIMAPFMGESSSDEHDNGVRAMQARDSEAINSPTCVDGAQEVIASSLSELPACPVCLDRLDDSVTGGALTIPCNHTFHEACLRRWGDSSCPVCRYCLRPDDEKNSCVECGTPADSLWICLICAHIGCGRYADGHAYEHFLATSHTYALDPATQRVWDYAGDNYVHRIIQGDDAKLIELPSDNGDGLLNSSDVDARGSNGVTFADENDKVDAITLEYTFLLTSQLEQQRDYYAQQMEQLEAEYDTRTRCADARVTEARAQLEEEAIARRSLEKRVLQTEGRSQSLRRQLEEEHVVSTALRDNQAIYLKKLHDQNELIKSLRAENDELRQQVTDLLMHIDGTRAIQESDQRDELAAGSISVGPGPERGSSSGHRRGRRNRR